LEKANVSQQEMTFYMEAIANDSTALVPLLRNGGKAFDELGKAALDAGIVMDETTIAAAKQFGIELQGLGQYITSAQTMLAAEFLPVLAQFSKDIN
ncbi:tail tape measure protein, partial [Pseudomonas sp. GW247-3R2A]